MLSLTSLQLHPTHFESHLLRALAVAAAVHKLTRRIADTLKTTINITDTKMTHRARSSKHGPSGQKMRVSHNSKPRHIPDVTGLSYGASLPLERESPFLERSYALSSAHPECSSQGHVQDFPWNLTGYENPPDSNVLLSYSGAHGEFPPSYAACVEEGGPYPPSYTASMESPGLVSNNLPWTSSNVDTSIYSSMDSDFDMLNGNALASSSSGLFAPLSTEVDLLSAHQVSDAMYSAHAFVSSGPYCHGNLPEGMQALPNNLHTFQRTAVESFPQSWTHGQHFPRMPQQMPLTPPASDHGTPPKYSGMSVIVFPRSRPGCICSAQMSALPGKAPDA